MSKFDSYLVRLKAYKDKKKGKPVVELKEKPEPVKIKSFNEKLFYSLAFGC